MPLDVDGGATADQVRQEFLAELKAATGVKFRVLTGEEEAFFGVLGVVNGLGLREGLVMDLGGGSAEVSRVTAQITLAAQVMFVRRLQPSSNAMPGTGRGIGHEWTFQCG